MLVQNVAAQCNYAKPAKIHNLEAELQNFCKEVQLGLKLANYYCPKDFQYTLQYFKHGDTWMTIILQQSWGEDFSIHGIWDKLWSMVLPPLYPGSLIPPRDQLWTHFPPSHPQPNPIPSSTQPPPVPPLQRQGCASSLTTTTLIIPLFATRQTIDHIYQWRATLNNICISCSFFVSLNLMVLFVHFGEILSSGNVNL